MKKKKWLYIAAAAAAVILLVLILTKPEITQQIPAIIISTLVGVALMMAVVLFAIFNVNRKRRSEESFRDNAVAVTGSVTKVERLPVKQREAIYGTGQDLFILRAAYEFEGKRYTGAKRSYFGRPGYNPGDPITVYVDPKDPAKSKILAEQHPQKPQEN